jgi:hypothetical protein
MTVRERPLIRRRFGVRATAPDAMARQFALVRAFRDRERRRVSVAAVIGIAVVAIVARSVAVARPGGPVTIVAFIGSSVAFAVITFVLAAVARPRDVTRALELYRWVARADWLRWQVATGDRVPSTPSRARAWLEAHPARGAKDDLPRIELLLWIGELETARRVALGLPATTPEERFDRALEVALVSFVGSGDGDLADARATIEELAATGAGEAGEAGVTKAGARLAVEEARRLAHARSDFLVPLVAARAAVGSAADGFLLPDLARWIARPLLLVGVLSATLTFLVAGALPPH